MKLMGCDMPRDLPTQSCSMCVTAAAGSSQRLLMIRVVITGSEQSSPAASVNKYFPLDTFWLYSYFALDLSISLLFFFSPIPIVLWVPCRSPAVPPAVLLLHRGGDLLQDSHSRFFFCTAISKRAEKLLVLQRGRIAKSIGCTLASFPDRTDIDQTQNIHELFPYKAICC